MQNVRHQFETIVVPNFRDFDAAEKALTAATRSGDPQTIAAASNAALRAGMNVAVAAYHLCDAVWLARAQMPWLAGLKNSEQMQAFIENAHCVMMRTPAMVRDLQLVAAVADAYKHVVLRNAARPVTTSQATLVVATGYGELGYGEGKYGGVNQVIVRLNNGQSRSLWGAIQNVVDMWRRFLGDPLQDWGQ